MSAVTTVKEKLQGLFTDAAKQQLQSLGKLGLTISTNQIAQAVRDVTGTAMNFVLDTNRDVRDRVEVLDSLIGWLYTFYGAKSDPIVRQLLMNWSLLVHRHWYGGAKMLLDDRIAVAGSMDPTLPSVNAVTKMVTRFAEKQILPWGRLMVFIAFDERLYTAEFVTMVQSMMAPEGNRFRGFGGEGGNPVDNY
jgi:hypothetical protein